MAWTERKIERLKQLWTDGAPASDIARDLDMTRNAVLGKLNRLGLLGKPGRRSESIRRRWNDPQYRRTQTARLKATIPKLHEALAAWRQREAS